MSRLRTSSPWTTPTTPLGARIMSEEPATLDAVPTMTLAEMEAVLAASAPMPLPDPAVSRPRLTQQGSRRVGGGRWAVGRRVLAAAAVLVALVGGTGGLAVGAGRPSTLGPASASASATAAAAAPGSGSTDDVTTAPATRGPAIETAAVGAAASELAAALGEAVALQSPSPVSHGSAPVPAPEAVLLPASVVRVDAQPAEAGAPAGVGAAMGEAASRMAVPSTTLAAAYP